MRTRTVAIIAVALVAWVVMKVLSGGLRDARLFEPHAPEHGAAVSQGEHARDASYRQPFDGFIVGGATRSGREMAANPRLVKAREFYDAEDWDALIAELDNVKILYPAFYEARVELAYAYLRRGSVEDLANSIEVAEAAARRVPDRWEAYYHKACALAAAGQQEAALGALREASERDAASTATRAVDDPDLSSVRGNPRFEAIIRAAQ